MNVYESRGVADCELVDVITRAEYETLHRYLGDAKWVSSVDPGEYEPEVSARIIVTEFNGKRLSYSDAPWRMTFDMFVRESARQAFDGSGAKLLPVSCNDGALFAVACPVVPAYDLEQTVPRRIPGVTRVMGAKKPVFRPELVEALHVFRDNSLDCMSPVYVTERFVERWQGLGLKGLEFGQFWLE